MESSCLGGSAHTPETLYRENKRAFEISPGEGAVEALSIQWGVPLDAARAIFAAGEESGRASCQRPSPLSVGNTISLNTEKHIEGTENPHDIGDLVPVGFGFNDLVTLEHLRNEQAIFSKARDWDQFHTPRNLALALVGEVGELCEVFQWKGEVLEGCPDFTPKEMIHVGQELSDVLLYLLRLAEKCHIDLPTVCLEKISLNGIKYPAGAVKGSSKKYNEY